MLLLLSTLRPILTHPLNLCQRVATTLCNLPGFGCMVYTQATGPPQRNIWCWRITRIYLIILASRSLARIYMLVGISMTKTTSAVSLSPFLRSSLSLPLSARGNHTHIYRAPIEIGTCAGLPLPVPIFILILMLAHKLTQSDASDMYVEDKSRY